MAIVNDLPEPCVCQITPPLRLPPGPARLIFAKAFLTAKYCGCRAILFPSAPKTMN
jgi:hypothetical protein